MNEHEKQNRIHIEPYSLIRDIVMNLWVVILAALIGFMSVRIWNQSMYTPMYTSTATLIVNVRNSASYSYTNLSSSSEMAKIYTEVFKQQTMKEYAAAHMQADRFVGSVSSSVLDNTNIFTVSVTTIMRSPNFPSAPSNTISDGHRTLIMLGCSAAVLALIVYLSVTRDTVKDEDTFKEKVDSKLFGTVLYERSRRPLKDVITRKKVPLLINNAYTSYQFTENYHKIANRIEYINRTEHSKVFLVTSLAENEGKSTTIANIALALAERGHRVALLDMDFKKPAIHKIFGIPNEGAHDFGSLLSGKIGVDEYPLQPYMKTGIDLMVNFSSHRDYVHWIHNHTARTMLDMIRNEMGYDYVLIDTPPLSVAADVTTFMQFVDKSIIVLRTDYVYAADINDAILSLKGKTDTFVGCVLNAVHKEFSLFSQFGLDETGYYGKAGGAYRRYDRYAPRAHEDDTQNE